MSLLKATRYIPIDVFEDNTHTSKVVGNKEFTQIAEDIVKEVLDYNHLIGDGPTVTFNPDLPVVTNDDSPQVREMKAVLMNVAVSMAIPIFLKCKNVLLINGYNKEVHNSFTVEDFDNKVPTTPVPEIACSLVPVLAKYIPEVQTKFYVVKPTEEADLFTYIYANHGVDVIETNKDYTLGDDYYNIAVPSDVKFDCIYLTSIQKTVEGSFDLHDLKQDFARYCTDDFVLIDAYRDRKLQNFINGESQTTKRIHGEQKDITVLCENLLRMQTPPASESNLVYDNVLPYFTKITKQVVKVY